MAWTKEQIEKRRLEIVGKKFGLLTVTSFSHGDTKRQFYNCVCDCGKEVVRRKDALRDGNSSCGCLQGELVKRTHKSRVKKAKGVITVEMLIDKEPYDAVVLIEESKKVDYYTAKKIYADWRKRFKKDRQAYIE